MSLLRESCRPLFRCAATLASRRFAATAAALAVKEAPVATSGKPTFHDFSNQLQPSLLKAITAHPFNYSDLSSVQEAVLDKLPQITGPKDAEVPPKDLLVKAKTGSGKTLAFLVPALQGFLQHRTSSPQPASPSSARHSRGASRRPNDAKAGILVLSPTRELATQIADEAKKLLTHVKDANVCLFVGGASKSMQLREWNNSSRTVVVATPGRMLDLLESTNMAPRLSELRTLILDEADTLLDMGFKDELEGIVGHLPSTRQTFLFSATVSPAIRKIAQATLKRDHEFIDCVPENERNLHDHVPQYVSTLQSEQQQIPHVLKLIAEDMLLNPQGGKALIFLPTTVLTQLYNDILVAMKPYLPWGDRKTRVEQIHSRLSQGARDRVSERFRQPAQGGYQILVTSDVSARGVDYPGITRVIQVGVPRDQNTYIHRVGRTGRAGKPGRGDIVLFPFEASAPKTLLRDVPLQKIDLGSFETDLKALAQKEDEHPTQPAVVEASASRSRDTPRAGRDRNFEKGVGRPIKGLPMPADIAGRLSEIDAAIEEVCFPELDKQDINDALMSMLGYYGGVASDLRVDRYEVLEGCKAYAANGLGLGADVYVPPGLIQKMGMRERPLRKNSFQRGGREGPKSIFGKNRGGSRDSDRSGGFRGGRSEGFQGRGDRSGGAPWMGRGQRSRSERRERY